MQRSVARACLLALFSAAAHGADVVISQVYGGGGNAGARWQQDFIEIVNRGNAPVPVAGWSVQYAGATGSTWQKVNLPAGVLQPGQYLLIGGAAGAVGAPLPPLDAAGAFNLGASGGKVALVASTVPIAPGTVCPVNVVDFVGYGGANCFEGQGPAPVASSATAVLRSGDGCIDRDSNAADFGVAEPLPRNSLAALARCAAPQVVRIGEIQGRAHLSPWASRAVAGVRGIVTARRADGFWMQDPELDGDIATSDAIFVAGNLPVLVGDAVEVGGIVAEVRSGAATNLTVTRINVPSVRVLSSGNALPPPVVIGAGGRVPPAKVIDDDATGDVETSGSFDPATDGIDFFESLEGMRVTVRNAVAVGPTGAFGETPVVGDNGALATLRSKNGGLLIAADDFNPERILLDNALIGGVPTVNAGDSLGAVTGIIDYSGGAYRLLLTERPIATARPALPERTIAQAPDQLAIASFNVQNLGATSPPEKFARVAARIVENLRSPDVVTLIEMQDDSGETDDGTVAASRNFANLILAILAAGGPQYDFRQIDPIDRADGGVPGGNIRVGLLFNPARVQFVDRPGGNATTPVAVLPGAAGPQLSLNPGRIDPGNPAFADSRKPLAAEFVFNGNTVFVVAVHFSSKGGDAPLFGRQQPPPTPTAAKRAEQAEVVGRFVRTLAALDAQANIVVLGDFNDFEFSTPLETLKIAGLVDLIDRLEPADRYSFNFQGNAQVLDHILVSPSLAGRAEYDIVHINADFADQVSDHDPEVVRLTLPRVSASEITAQVTVTQTRPRLNAASGRYNGSIRIANASGRPIAGPIHVLLGGVPPGVTVVNAAGARAGVPYLTHGTANLAVGASISVPVKYAAPSRPEALGGIRVFSRALD